MTDMTEKNYSSEKQVKGELGLNSCGTQTLSGRNFHTVRKRVDYSLMYVSKGKAEAVFGKKRVTLREGQAMLYPPYTEQDYAFFGDDNSINKWAHFGGRLAASLGTEARVVTPSDRTTFERTLDDLIKAYNGLSPAREMYIKGHLSVLIGMLTESESGKPGDLPRFSHRMTDVLNYIHINAFSGVDLDRCAAMCYLSRDRFNHVFREVTGTSPVSYITKIRMERAAILLRDLGMTVRECAESVGYRDTNYFCRVFRKENGISPGEYARNKK